MNQEEIIRLMKENDRLREIEVQQMSLARDHMKLARRAKWERMDNEMKIKDLMRGKSTHEDEADEFEVRTY